VPDGVSLKMRIYKTDDLIMFPTRHDTTPGNIKTVLGYLTRQLKAGNNILYVSKARLDCMQQVCTALSDYKNQLLIRVTIGSMHPVLVKFWDRKAPSTQERLQALQYAKGAGFQTSISMEPILHGVEDAVATFRAVEPVVTEKVWIGAMEYPDTRVDTSNPNYKKAVDELKVLQSQSELVRLYELLKDEPKVSWKESIRRAVGLE
jgi:hypothetical protein